MKPSCPFVFFVPSWLIAREANLRFQRITHHALRLRSIVTLSGQLNRANHQFS